MVFRVSCVLFRRDGVFDFYDLQSFAKVRKEEPIGLSLDLLNCRLSICHGNQGVRHRTEAHAQRAQSVYASFDVCVRYCGDSMHLDSDELLQQGFESVLHVDVSI